MNELVSIIIPVFNGEMYVDRLILSVASQTYRPLEVIIIDDGSVDSSLNKLYSKVKELEVDDLKFIILSQDNKGIANTRNLGIKISSGKYIMFHDQDDWMDKNCVEILVKEMISGKYDMVISGYRSIDDRGICKTECSLDPLLSWSKYRITAPWGRIFLKELINNNKIFFYDTKISEDLYFNIFYISSSKKVKVISYVGYNWYYNKNSESHLNWSKLDKERDPFIMLDDLHKKIRFGNWNDKNERAYFFTKYLIWYLLYTARGSQKEELKRNIQRTFCWLEQNYPTYRFKGVKDIKYPLGEPLIIKVGVMVIMILYKLGLVEIVLRIYRNL